MNSIERDYFPILREYQALRPMALDLLTDADLAYAFGGDTPSLGAQCVKIGEVQHAYVASIQSRSIDFGYRSDDPKLPLSVASLRAWYAELDTQLYHAVAGLSDQEIDNWSISRPGGFTLPLRIHLEVYKEALLLFYGRTDVYVSALGKTLPERWVQWLG